MFSALSGFNPGCPRLSLCKGQVAYALLTRPPLSILNFIRRIFSKLLARLACVKHAASVHPEPGSNSYFICILSSLYIFSYTYEVKICFDQTQFRLRSLIIILIIVFLSLEIVGNHLQLSYQFADCFHLVFYD